MKLFLKKVFLFVLILGVYCGIMFGINLHLINKKPQPIPKKHILIIGDSHTNRAINPKLLSSAYNISLRGQPYCVSYWTLKKVIKYYGCDTVLISFSHENISGFNDLKFADNKWSTEMFSRVYTLIPLDSLKDFKFDNVEYYRTIFKYMMLYPVINPVRYIGKQYPPNKLNLYHDYQDATQRHFYNDGDLMSTSKNQIKYLKLMIDLCKKNNITPILISTPVHKLYRQYIPPTYISSFDSLKTALIKQNVTVLDYSAAPFSDKEFMNSDHLNVYGSTRFTHIIDSALRNLKKADTPTPEMAKPN